MTEPTLSPKDKALKALLAMLDDPDPSVRISAADTLLTYYERGVFRRGDGDLLDRPPPPPPVVKHPADIGRERFHA